MDVAVEDYLALRHGLGFTLKGARPLLVDFTDFLDRNDAKTITTDLAVAWATTPTGVHPIWWRQRLGMVREFARYLATSDPLTQIPAADLLPAHYSRRTPYQYSEAEITALMAAAAALSPPVRAATYTALIGLLMVTGLCVSEALGLDSCDLRINTSSLIVRRDKTAGAARSRCTTRACTHYLPIAATSSAPSPNSPRPVCSSRSGAPGCVSRR